MITFPRLNELCCDASRSSSGPSHWRPRSPWREEGGIDQSEIEGAVENLVNKSLIVVWPSYRGMLYRLLDTTRSYALEKLAASAEHNSIAARHCSHFESIVGKQRGQSFSIWCPDDLWQTPYSTILEISVPRLNGALVLMEAMAWPYGMAAVASQLFLAKSLFVECRDWMERAIDRMAADCDPRDQMEIHASLALSLMFTAGNSERVRDAFNTALTFAERHEDAYLQLRLLSGLSMYLHRTIDASR